MWGDLTLDLIESHLLGDDDEGESEEADGVPGTAILPSEAELTRRAALTAFSNAHKARIRGERADPCANVHVDYLVDFFLHIAALCRIAELEASVRHAVLLHVVHHHERHLLHNGGAVAPDPVPYVRRHRARSLATDSFAVGDPPRFDDHPLQRPGAVIHPEGTASRGRPGEVASDRPPSPSAIVTYSVLVSEITFIAMRNKQATLVRGTLVTA